jgi:hypothetical protein
MVEARPDFLHQLFREEMRLQPDVLKAEQEYFDRLWYYRSTRGRVGGPDDPVDSYEPKLRATVLAARARIEAQFDKQTGDLGRLRAWHDQRQTICTALGVGR